MIFFKTFLSLDRIGEFCNLTLGKSLLPAVRSGATGLPTELQRYDCNMLREQMLAGAKGLGHSVAPVVLPTV